MLYFFRYRQKFISVPPSKNFLNEAMYILKYILKICEYFVDFSHITACITVWVTLTIQVFPYMTEFDSPNQLSCPYLELYQIFNVSLYVWIPC